MAIRLFSEFKSDNGTQYKIEIHDANWLAVATEFNVDSRGFDLTYEGETDDIVSPIVGSKLTFGAYSTNGTFETFIDTLKTFQENRFQLVVRKYNGTSYDLYWAGWITQDLVNVEDSSQPYIYEITATDGIGRLANIDYDDNNSVNETNGFKVSRITDVLKTAFNKIGTSDLWGSSDVFFETSADWWETNAQTYSTTNDPLATQGFDVRYFREKDDDGNDVYSSTLEILRQVATLYNARIFMQNGRFVFEQYGNRDAASRYVSRYTKTATHIGRVLVSDDVTIDQSTNGARRAGNNWNFLPAAQLAKIHYVQRFLNPFNAFGQYRFRTTNVSYTAGFIAGGSGIQLNLGSTSFNFKVVGAPTATSPIFPVFKIRIRIQDSSTGTFYYCNRTYNGYAAGGAMFGIPAWSTTPGEYFFDLPSFFSSGTAVVNYPVAIITPDIPVNGEIDFVLSLHGVFRAGTGATYTPTQTPLFDSIFIFGIETNGATNAPGATFSSTNNDASVDSNLTIDLGDVVIADGPRQSGHLAAYNGTAWVGTEDWRKGSTGTALPILKLLSNETLALHVRPIEQYNGNVIGTFYLGQRIVFDSEAYLMTGGTFAANTDEWSGTWYRIQTIRASVSELPELPDLVSRNTIASATTSGVSPNDIVGGRISGMDIDIENEKIGPFQQTSTGARVNGTMNVTGDVTLDAGLDVDGVSQFNNDVNITGSVTSTGPLTGEYIQLDTTYNTTPVQGQIVWSQDDGTIDVGLNSNVVMQVGQEEFWFVKNQTGSTIPKGTAVRAAGTLGASGRILAAPMVADGSVPARFFLGIAAEDILDGGEGYVTTFGKIRQLNTSAFTEGAVLWCNPAVAGGLTSTEPAAPNLKLAVAFVVRSNATSGVLAVRSETGSRVSDASDVQITSVADNDLLQYNTATSRWENVAGTTTNIGEGTNLYFTDARSRAAISETIDGVSYNNTTGVFSLDAGRVIVTTTQTGQWDTAYNDRIVSAAVTGTTSKTLTLTQGDGGTITATWSDYDTAPVTSVNGLTGDVVLTTSNIGEGTNLYFTNARARLALSAGTGITYNNTTGVITNAAPDQVVALTASTAIAVTGTYPSFTIENTAPDQVVAVTAGTGVGVTGAYPNFTISNTAPDQVVAVTASTGIAVTGTYPSFTIENTAPDQVVALTASTGISVTGTYPNFTITNTSPSSGGTLTGGGTTNYLSKWTAGTALGDSLVFDNGTNVGIGTALPLATLDVNGNIFARSDIRIGGDYAGNSTAIIKWQGGAADRLGIFTWGDAKDIQIGGNNVLFATESGIERMRITAAGAVGIGTTAPTYKLDVVGEGRTSGAFMAGGAINIDSNLAIQISSAGAGTQRWIGINKNNGYGLIIGYNENAASLNGVGAYIRQVTSDPIHFLIDNVTTAMSIVSGGNVGIGIASPSYKLQIAEDAYARIALHQTTTGAIWNWGNDGSNMYAYYTNTGVRALDITPTGNVGIGTTSPASKLDITSINGDHLRLSYNSSYYWELGREAADGRLSFTDSQNGERVTITAAGNVGIGTTAPAEKLHVSGRIMASGSGYVTNPTAPIFGQYTADRGYVQVPSNGRFEIWNGGTYEIATFYENLNSIFHGNVGIGTTAPEQKLHVAGNISIRGIEGGTYGSLRFGTNNSTYYDAWAGIDSDWEGVGINVSNLRFYTSYGSRSERMRITSAGNVGIGTTAPTAKLEVVSNNINAWFKSATNEVPVSIFNTGGAISTIGFRDTSSTSEYHVRIGANATSLVSYTNNTERMRITSGGNVGIGTTAPGYKLSVAGNGHSWNINPHSGGIDLYSTGNIAPHYQTTFDWYTGAPGAGTFRMGLTAAGNLGIGTTAPTAKLDVAGGGVSTDFRISRSVDPTAYFSINAPGGSPNASTIGINGVDVMTLRVDGNVGIGTTAPAPHNGSNALIVKGGGGGRGIIEVWDGTAGKAVFQQVGGDTYVGSLDKGTGSGDLYLLINGTGSNADVGAVLKANGNVGIGTTSPVARLQVASPTNAVDVLRIGNTAGDSGSVQGVTHLAINHFNAGTNPSTRITAYQDGVSGWPGGMYFSTRSLNTDSAPVERMRITSGGNVGIGTTAPSHLLHVAGDVRIDAADSAPQVNYFESSLNYVYGEEGAQEIILGKPDVWLRINVDGIDYVFPGYNVTA